MENTVSLNIIDRNNKNLILKTICAYANAEKGTTEQAIAIVVRDENDNKVPYGSELGIDLAKKEAYRLVNLVKHISPDYMPEVRIGSVEGYTAIILICAYGKEQPYSCPIDVDEPLLGNKVYTLDQKEKEDNEVEIEWIEDKKEEPIYDDEDGESNLEFDLNDNDEEVTIEDVKKSNEEMIKALDERQQYNKELNENLDEATKEIEKMLEELSGNDLDVSKQEIEADFEDVNDIILKDTSNNGYTKERNFIGSDDEQIEALMTYLTNYVFETRTYSGNKKVSNYNPDVVEKMVKEAKNNTNHRLQVLVGPKNISLCFDDKNAVNKGTYDKDTAKLAINCHPDFKDIKPTIATRRRTQDETRVMILKILQDGAVSTNGLSHKLGYKGISKTLSGIVQDMIDDGLIEYTNKKARGSNQKLRLVTKTEGYSREFTL